MDKLGAVDAVAASLAHISGTKEIKSRSLLTGRDVCTGYKLKHNVYVQSSWFAATCTCRYNFNL